MQRAPEAAASLSGLRFLALLALLGAASGCTEIKEKAGEAQEALRKLRGVEPAPASPAPPPTQTAKPRREATPTGRPISIHAACEARDERGYAESIRLALDDGRVAQLEAKIDIPRRGSCQFHLAEFRQTRTAPHVELLSNSGSACVVRMWEQSGRVTVAFSGCEEKCTRGAFDYLWPVELNARSGTCL